MKKFIPALLTGLLSTLVASQSAYAGSSTIISGIISSVNSNPGQQTAATATATTAFSNPNPTPAQVTAVQTASVLGTTPVQALADATSAATTAFGLTAGVPPTAAQIQAVQSTQLFFGTSSPNPQQVQAVANVQILLNPPGATPTPELITQTTTLLQALGVNITPNTPVTISPAPLPNSPAAIAANTALGTFFGNNAASSTAVVNALNNLRLLFPTP
jgi:hypothetical protein